MRELWQDVPKRQIESSPEELHKIITRSTRGCLTALVLLGSIARAGPDHDSSTENSGEFIGLYGKNKKKVVAVNGRLHSVPLIPFSILL